MSFFASAGNLFVRTTLIIYIFVGDIVVEYMSRGDECRVRVSVMILCYDMCDVLHIIRISRKRSKNSERKH